MITINLKLIQKHRNELKKEKKIFCRRTHFDIQITHTHSESSSAFSYRRSKPYKNTNMAAIRNAYNFRCDCYGTFVIEYEQSDRNGKCGKIGQFNLSN